MRHTPIPQILAVDDPNTRFSSFASNQAEIQTESRREESIAAPLVKPIVSDEFSDIPIIDLKTFIDSSKLDPDSISEAARTEC